MFVPPLTSRDGPRGLPVILLLCGVVYRVLCIHECMCVSDMIPFMLSGVQQIGVGRHQCGYCLHVLIYDCHSLS